MWGKNYKPKKETIFEDDDYTVLGKGLDLKGNARFEGTVWIDSFFEGEIMSDDLLIIGEHAVIKGSIVCGSIISSGLVMGDISARTKVQLLKPAVLIGNVHSPSFSVEEGVNFRGFSDVGATLSDVLGVNPQQSENGRHDWQQLGSVHDINGEKPIPTVMEDHISQQPDLHGL